MIGVIDIQRLEDLEAYRGAWDDLRSQTRVAEQVPAWDQLVAWKQAVGAEQDMRVQIVVMHGIVVGIWPLMVHRLRTQMGVVRRLTSIFGGCGIWQGPIGPNLAASLHSVMHHLRSVAPDWDVFEFSQISADSPLLKRLVTALEAQGFQPQRQRGPDIGMINWGLQDGYTTTLRSYQVHCYRMSIRSQLLRWKRIVSRMINGRGASPGAILSASGDSDPRTASMPSGPKYAMETSHRGAEGATVRSLSHLRIFTESDSVEE